MTSTTAVGGTDADGDAGSFVVTYQITPPGGSWVPADDGVYTITLGGEPITDLAGNAVAAGIVGTFSVTGPNNTPTVVVGSTLPGSTYGQSVSFKVAVSGSGSTPTGTVQFLVDGTDLGSPVALSNGDATSTAYHVAGCGQPHD